MTTNPEQDVIDAIDALVDEQMAGGEVAHRDRARIVNSDRCSLCGGAWHGKTWTGIDYAHLGEYDQHDHGRLVGCPGASATTGPQRIRWRWSRSRVRTGTFQMVGPGEGYTVADLMGMRWSRDPLQPPMVRFWDGNFNLIASTADLEDTPDWVTELMRQTIAYCDAQIQAMLGMPGAITLDPATVGELVAEIPLNEGTPAAPAVYVDQVEAIRWGSDEPVRAYARTWLPGDDVDPYFRPIGYVTGDGPRVIDEDGHDLGSWCFDGSRAVLAIEAVPTTTYVQRVLQTLRRWLHP
ncbi:hypothetical protein [Mycobacteroides abscessus]|uniref:hypothetical protein n=1 Tax=Mycobacteroides abscessus TaxID=36809 RepID=UPI001F1C2E1F|nr:hypothetical protein [Mycobacteroides abscessus]MDO3023444.1 hypothetical protein [Mycobacteroides abscessus subsp. abscessus]